MKTQNQIIKALNDFANAHHQIKSFGSGSIQDFATSGTTNYSAMWVDYEPATVQDRNVYIGLRIYICDRLLKGKRNEREVLSDVLSICLDTVAQMSSNIYGWKLDTSNVSMIPFSDPKHDDEVAGYYFDLSFKQAFDYNRCQIPLSSEITNPGSTDVVTILDQDGNVITRVSAGNTYSVIVVSNIFGGNASTTFTNSIIQP